MTPLPDFFPLCGFRLAVALRDVGEHQVKHPLRVFRGEGGRHQRAQRMADQYGLLYSSAVQHSRQRVGVIAGIRRRRRQHRAFAITGHIQASTR